MANLFGVRGRAGVDRGPGGGRAVPDRHLTVRDPWAARWPCENGDNGGNGGHRDVVTTGATAIACVAALRSIEVPVAAVLSLTAT